jgi:succinate dehydrogenase / fumarate reductase, flavoprotein subunit
LYGIAVVTIVKSTDKSMLIEQKSLILAAGGYTRVYAVSSSRIFENYGEGITLAYEAGVDLVDMEMVQFHPTGMVWPEEAVGTLATEAIRGEGGILLNSKGERFMKNYDPERMELGPFLLILYLSLYLMSYISASLYKK